MTDLSSRRAAAPRLPLTPTRIEAAIRDHVAAVAKARASGSNGLPADVQLRDSAVVGLSVRIRSTGSATFVVLYRVGGRQGALRRYVIGPTSKVQLAEARKRARAVVAQVQDGRDVAAEKRAQAQAASAQAAVEAERLTLGGLLDRYERDIVRRGVKDWRADMSLLRRVLLAAFGEEADPASLTRAKLVGVLDGIRDGGEAGKSKKAGTRIHSLFSFAADQGLIETHPLAGRRVVKTKAERHAAAETEGGRALTMAEVATLWRACGDERMDKVVAAYVRLLMISGCRRSEIAQAELNWIERETPLGMPVLVLPRTVTKNGFEHAVPLPQLALDVIGSVRRLASTKWLFPAGRGRGHLSGWTHRWAKVMEIARDHGLKGELTLHDLRRTARSHWTRLGVEEQVAELMLNHRPSNALIATYDREQRLTERAAALQSWCEAIVAAAGAAAPLAAAA